VNPINRIEKKIPNPQKTADRILRALPEWFGIESAIVRYAEEPRRLLVYFHLKTKRLQVFSLIKFTPLLRQKYLAWRFIPRSIGEDMGQHSFNT
jgi:hypothetical protein